MLVINMLSCVKTIDEYAQHGHRKKHAGGEKILQGKR